MKCKTNIKKKININGVYSRNNLPKITDETYAKNLDEYESIGTHWVALYVNGNNIKFFDNFGVEHIPKKIKQIIGNKNITNIYRVQAYDWIMCQYSCFGFIEFMLKGKSLLE